MIFFTFVNAVLLAVIANNINGDTSIVPPRCSKIACKQLLCIEGYALSKLPTECCASCKPIKPDCTTVKCAQVLECPTGQKSVKPSDKCCAQCVPDCKAVRCKRPTCTGDQVSEKPDGQCCEQCVLNCAAASCLGCTSNQTAISSPDRCCLKCVDKQ